ncbi:efflux RND transporter periplasmic adaptor subunit [Novipirellula artificiosorum]|uniref:CzcB-like barrel-sandwich hybrid domain-containing protein n=1 Tax=Novipirellula artificiosorum TaxID=2528016 RepID=A0A5C6CZP6_9BACT|nr:efflux RND transporter periplasmic adaptor subunit [Novipirellula artificiosorum]TWU28951.1 hypothetical protein Poly41_68040 [Novipirellula artificiosorum]
MELFVAGVALIAWQFIDSLTWKQVAADFVLLASVTSLLFNLNPLLRFDGYFALADATGVDNLYNYGQSYARYFGGRYILGLNQHVPPMPAGNPPWVKVYGLSAAAYRVVTISGLIIAAAFFHGAGLVIAAAGLISFILLPLYRLGVHLVSLKQSGDLYPTRLLLRLGILFAAILPLTFVIPTDLQMTTPAIVQYDPPLVVRAPLDGFVDQVHVLDGETVTDGQPLVTLRNDDLVQSLGLLQKEIAQMELAVRSARWNGDTSLLGDSQSQLIGLREQVEAKQQELDSLVVRAPGGGRVVARQLAWQLGCYVHQGDELGAIGVEQQKRLKISLSQREASRHEGLSTNPVLVVMAGQPSWMAQISHVESRASVSIPDESLIAINGGNLPVLKTETEELLLSEPRINAFISLTAEQSQVLRCGQRAFVRIKHRHATLGSQFWNYLSGLIVFH